MKHYNKIASMIKFTNAELVDIPTVMEQYHRDISHRYNEVLRLVMEQYLGREVDVEIDKDVFKFKELPNSDTKELYPHDVLMGKLKTEFGLSDNDFMQNRVSCVIAFTPAVAYASTPPNSN